MNRAELEQTLRVYLVADPEHTRRDLVDDVRAALSGGVTMVQLRAKRLTDREALGLARVLLSLCQERGVPFLINDRVDLALAVRAEGVHLGVDDLPLNEARRLLPPGAIIGYSPETDDQAREAPRLGADYLGVGPVFGTSTKADAGDAIGPRAVGRRAMLSGLPAIGIGGITPENTGKAIAAGAIGVAVVGAILGRDDPADQARRLLAATRDARTHLDD